MPNPPASFFRRNLDGRWLTFAMVALYAFSFVTMHFLYAMPYYKAWSNLGVDSCTTPFLDLQMLPAAVETIGAGGNPRDFNPTDPQQRQFCYPRWWLYCDYVGLNRNTVEMFGVGMGLLTLCCVFLALGRIGWNDGLMAGCFLLSPAVMLGFERGNIDLSIFCLLTLALSLRRIVPAATLVILLAAILKIYPAFSLLALIVPPWRKILPWLIGATVLLLFYFIMNFKELDAISQNTPLDSHLSYGSISFVTWLCILDICPHSPQRFQIVLIGAMVILVLGSLAVWNRPRLDTPLVFAERELFAFRLGAGIFLGTFALGSNYDYRTIFLAFCLPLLFRLRREAAPIKTWANAALFFSLFYVTWHLFSDDGGLIHPFLKHSMSWGLLVSLIGILAATFFPNRPKSVSNSNE